MTNAEILTTEKPLYCYKLEEDRGGYEVTRYRIDEYKKGTKAIFYDGKAYGLTPYRRETIKYEKLDSLKNNKVFTFNPDRTHFENIVTTELANRKQKAEAEYKKYANRLEMWTITVKLNSGISGLSL